MEEISNSEMKRKTENPPAEKSNANPRHLGSKQKNLFVNPLNDNNDDNENASLLVVFFCRTSASRTAQGTSTTTASGKRPSSPGALSSFENPPSF